MSTVKRTIVGTRSAGKLSARVWIENAHFLFSPELTSASHSSSTRFFLKQKLSS